jgi:uncharacterized protein YbjT (DUF2867 family)
MHLINSEKMNDTHFIGTVVLKCKRSSQMKTQDLTLIVGASGTVGSEMTRLLKEQGQNVRTTTSRKENVDGNKRMHVNLATGEGLSQAFDGVTKAFFLSPPGYADHYSMLAPLIQEAKRRSLKKVVLMTAMGANASDSTPFRRAEIELEKSGLNYNIIRPNWFLQNFNTFWIQGINQHGKILVPAGKAKTSFIDARDVSAVAAKLLTTDQYVNKDFDLTGAVAYDHDEIAAAISEVSARTIAYQEIEPQIFRQGLVQAGLPGDYSDFLVLIFGFLREGYSSAVNNNVKMITGQQPRSLKQYTADFKKSWI